MLSQQQAKSPLQMRIVKIMSQHDSTLLLDYMPKQDLTFYVPHCLVQCLTLGSIQLKLDIVMLNCNNVNIYMPMEKNICMSVVKGPHRK